MKYRELEKLVEQWIEQSIITKEQGMHMLANTAAEEDSRKWFVKLLPIFASILLALSVLTFIASNWDVLTAEFKLIIIFVFLIGFYGAGAFVYEKRNKVWGIGLLFLGIISFGAGMILIGQTFHYVSYSAVVFCLWGLAAYLVALMYRNPFLVVVSAVIWNVGQIYSGSSFSTIHVGILVLSALGLGYLVFKEKKVLYSRLFTISTLLQWSILLPISFHQQEHAIWQQLCQYTLPFVIVALLHVIGEVESKPYRHPLKTLPIIGLYFYYVVNILLPDAFTADVSSSVIAVYVISILLLFTVSFYMKKKRQEPVSTLLEWVLFFPVLFLPNADSANYAALFMVILYPVSLLVQGYKTTERKTIRLGSNLLIVSIFTVYFQFGFTFLSKSLFFLIGALIVTGLYFFLTHKQKELFEEEEERK
ncbi:DUF2157 domain-containing protein [Bacillus sp. 165]|uniref:DUF2157 domain-containing protein n=1 Tax=Bacillus sp. 165 TaxID=1529117 RepID=UPI001ADD07AC|nr:DUF2157 domain-containing protein [Bacillus sp. 165]